MQWITQLSGKKKNIPDGKDRHEDEKKKEQKKTFLIRRWFCMRWEK